MLAFLSFPENGDVSPMYEKLIEKENPAFFILMGYFCFIYERK